MTTTNFDYPAMPCSFFSPSTGPENYYGLTAREHAGILLIQPTGTPWLDEMIHARRRDELAKAALNGFLGNPDIKAESDELLAKATYLVADAMIAATRPTDNGEGKQ